DGGDGIVIDHNTVATNDATIVSLYGGSASAPTPVTHVSYTNNMSEHRTYGIIGAAMGIGNPSITAYFPGGTVSRNVLAGGQGSIYPATNFFPTVASWQATFVNYAAGDYRLTSTSPFKNAGTDGADLGANLALVTAHAAAASSGDDRTSLSIG